MEKGGRNMGEETDGKGMKSETSVEYPKEKKKTRKRGEISHGSVYVAGKRKK